MKRVSVIVPAYREKPELLKNCIDSLMAQNYKNYKVLLVLDSACSAEIKKKAKELSKLGRLTVIQDRKRVSASHRNIAVKRAWADSDYFAFTDADCVADENWLRELVACIEKMPKKVGCVGGVNLSKETGFVGKAIECAESSFIGGGGVSGQTTIRKKIRYVNSIPNCNAIYRKECWVDNKQDEKFIKGQDAEFNLRLAKQGWKFVQTPKAKIFHKKQDKLSDYAKRMYNYGKASANIIKKHGFYGLRRFWYGAGIAVFYSLLFILIVISIFFDILPIVVTFLALYLLAVVIAVLIIARKNTISSCFFSPIIVLIQHLSYALGFLFSIVRTIHS